VISSASFSTRARDKKKEREDKEKLRERGGNRGEAEDRTK
jgi:hypothetical protein